jgi:hypothetical protein
MFEGENGLFYKKECPVEEPEEEVSTVDCFNLSINECTNYNECELWQTGKRLTYNFYKENFCVDRSETAETITVTCAKKEDCGADTDEPSSISQYNDIMKNSKTGQLILVNRDDCRSTLPNSLDEGIGDWEMDLETFSEMLVYYQNLSMQDATIYTFPKECE